MPDNEQKLQEYLDRMQHRQDGSALTFPNSLPPKMKELLAELAMVEKEITRLESQINQLKAEAKHEKEVHMESKSKEWERGTLKNHHESSPLPPDPNTICRRSNEVAFEIKALRFISKAIKEDHKLSDFSINEKAMNSRRFSTQKENTFYIGPYKNLVRFTSSSVDLKRIKNSSSVPLFQKLKVLMDGLQKVDLRFLIPSVSSPEKLLTLINRATLNISGNSINAQAIERFILRKPADSLDKQIFGKGDKYTKEMIVYELYGLDTPDPNIVFALCCGTRSSPAVKIYTADDVTAELERSKLEYLQAAIMVTSTKKIALPELLLRNMHDFAQDMDSLMEWMCHQLPTSGSLRKSIFDCLRGLHGGKASAVVEKIPYDFEFQYLLAI
ncbi:hypothetical protein Pfo_018071 [Paulownia fortunei]|nr:hypothetical protein Pfo_018071 [Paulownia fortunei]